MSHMELRQRGKSHREQAVSCLAAVSRQVPQRQRA